MQRLEHTHSEPSPARANHPFEKWRKKQGYSARDAANLFPCSKEAYIDFVRCRIAPLKRVQRAAELSGISLSKLATYQLENQSRRGKKAA